MVAHTSHGCRRARPTEPVVHFLDRAARRGTSEEVPRSHGRATRGPRLEPHVGSTSCAWKHVCDACAASGEYPCRRNAKMVVRTCEPARHVRPRLAGVFCTRLMSVHTRGISAPHPCACDFFYTRNRAVASRFVLACASRWLVGVQTAQVDALEMQKEEEARKRREWKRRQQLAAMKACMHVSVYPCACMHVHVCLREGTEDTRACRRSEAH